MIKVDALPKSKKLIMRISTFTCMYCSRTIGFTEVTLEHILPKARGGRDTPKNCGVACKQCNAEKGDMTLTEYRFFKETGRYHPTYLAYLEANHKLKKEKKKKAKQTSKYQNRLSKVQQRYASWDD